jgi:hypothetical protein
VAVTGHRNVRPVVVVTAGFGRVPHDPVAFGLLLEREGQLACACGKTRVRAGAVRPEVLVPENGAVAVRGAPVSAGDVRESRPAELAVGRRVRLVAGPLFGRIGTVTALPAGTRAFPGGGRFPAVEIGLAGDRRAVAPRANVELLDDMLARGRAGGERQREGD